MSNLNDRIDKIFQIEDTLWVFYNNSDMLKCLVNREGKFIHVNKKWTEVTGWSLVELTQKEFIEFVHDEDKVRTIEAYNKSNKGELPLHSEFINRYKCKDGSFVTLLWIIDDMGDKELSLATAKIYG